MFPPPPRNLFKLVPTLEPLFIQWNEEDPGIKRIYGFGKHIYSRSFEIIAIKYFHDLDYQIQKVTTKTYMHIFNIYNRVPYFTPKNYIFIIKRYQRLYSS